MALVSYKKHPILHELSATITSPEERTKLVESLLEKYPLDKEAERVQFAILEMLSDYIVFAAVREEKEKTRKLNKSIITPSKATTINKREISMQRLQEAAEYDEVIETHMNEDKNTLLTRRPNQLMTDKDKEEIPYLSGIDETIQQLRYKVQNNVMLPKDANTMKQMIIELESDKYIIEEAYKKPVKCNSYMQSKSQIEYNSDTGYYIINSETGEEEFKIISENYLDFFNPKTWSELIKLYGPLKESSWEELNSDMHWIIKVFEDTVDRRFKRMYPMFFDMMCWRIDKLTNKDISILLQKKYSKKHNEIYVSTTLTRTIPLLLMNEYQRNWIINMYSKPYFLLRWKRCSTCGEIKPRVPFFWTRNSSGDGFYSKCKDCRNGSTARALSQIHLKPNEDFDEAAFIDELIKNRL